jgi:alkylation response protein AidB-like acyl-CoA dehydrogenase
MAANPDLAKFTGSSDAPPPPLPDYLRKAPVHCPHPDKAARELRELIDSHSDEAERIGYLPEPVVRAVADSGLYGMMVPKELGGAEPHPSAMLDAVAEMAYADGSTGWAVMASQFGTHAAGVYGSERLVEAMFRSGTGFTAAAQISKLGRADRVDGGYRIQGLFQFGSGSREAAWFGGAFVEHDGGKPVPNEQGQPTVTFFWAPREKIRMRGNWDVMGLGATASYDFEFPEQFVDPEFAVIPQRRRGGPSTHIQVSLGHGAWALGAARRALDEVAKLARTKKRFGRTGIIDHQTFQLDYARAEAKLRAAFDYCRAAFTRHYEAAARDADGIQVHADYRLAACWAVETGYQVAQFAWAAGGSDILRNRGGENRLQRCFRDLCAGYQHRHTDYNTEIDCAQVFLGINDPKLVL